MGIYQPDEHIDRQAQKKHKRHKHKIDKEGWFPHVGVSLLLFNQHIIHIINNTKHKHNMKRIEAIIRKTKFEDVKEALLQSDIDWFEYHNVHGIGQSREERIYRGVQYSTDVIERVALTIVCRDQFVKPTVKVILKVAHTGEIGDGRIFVSDMIDTWSIRTGENGDTVLRDKK